MVPLQGLGRVYPIQRIPIAKDFDISFPNQLVLRVRLTVMSARVGTMFRVHSPGFIGQYLEHHRLSVNVC